MLLALTALVIVAGLFLFDGRAKKPSAAQPETLARYCQLVNQFDSLAPSVVAGGAPADTSATSVGQILDGMGPTLQEMERDAPTTLRSDVVAVVTALQEAAKGNMAAIRAHSYLVERQRLTSYSQKMCFVGFGSNEQ